MKKAFITGITGFAGSHLAEYLLSLNEYEVTGTHISDDVRNVENIKDKIKLYKVDLMDEKRVSEVLGEVKPDVIFHLAALTFVGGSFKNPSLFITNNVTAQINIHEAVAKNNLHTTKLIIISSSHIYGIVKPEDLPIDEETPFTPDNPYSVSKMAQDYIGLSYSFSHNQQVIRFRPFNHVGPRLSPDISISRWSKTIAEIEKGEKEPILRVGNLTTKRDFTDVRDMVRAYETGMRKCQNREVYNIGSGKSHTMQKTLDTLLSFSKVPIRVESDQNLMRPSDIPELLCDPRKFENATGWKPEIQFEQTLRDTLDYWRRIV